MKKYTKLCMVVALIAAGMHSNSRTFSLERISLDTIKEYVKNAPASCWGGIKQVPNFPGRTIAHSNAIASIHFDGVLSEQSWKGLFLQGIISFAIYYGAFELIDWLMQKRKKRKRDLPKYQMMRVCVEQLLFLKNVQKKLEERSGSADKR